MVLFGKKIGEYVAFSRTRMILIVLMGSIRFLVGISGIPYERATHLASMTILSLFLGFATSRRKSVMKSHAA